MVMPPRADRLVRVLTYVLTELLTATRESVPEGSGTSGKNTLPRSSPITGVPLSRRIARNSKDSQEEQCQKPQNNNCGIDANIDPRDDF